MEASVISLGVALVAVVAALVAAVALARQRPRAVRAAQSRHPAATPPVSITLVREGRDAHWRVEVRASAPPTSIDIVSYRAAGSGGPWENEPIVEPILLQPGGWAVLPTVVVGRAPTYDVVMGWTEHTGDGDRTGSGSFTVHEAGPAVVAPPGRHGGWIVTAVAIAVLLLIAGTIVVTGLVDRWGDDEVDTVATAPPVPKRTDPVPTSAPATSAASTVVTTVASTEPDPTTTPPTTAPATSAAPTSAPATSAPSTSAPPTGPRVIAVGRVEDCRFGSDCLVVGFLIDGFDVAPTEYVCEFADGERISFGFVGGGAETACSARSASPSITIEVAGVRSNTVTPDDLGPLG